MIFLQMINFFLEKLHPSNQSWFKQFVYTYSITFVIVVYFAVEAEGNTEVIIKDNK